MQFCGKNTILLRQKLTKEEKKMKREDEIENEIQYAYCPERYVTMILTIPAFSLSKLPFRKNNQHLNK